MFLFHSKKDGVNLQALDVICVAIFFASATYGIKAMVSYVGLADYEDQASLLWYILWAIVYGRFLWSNKSMIVNFVVAEAIYATIMYFNYKLYPDTREFYEEYQMFIRQIVVVYIPSMTVALRITDFSDYIKYFRTLGLFGMFFMLLAYFMNYTERWDYQYFGVQLTPFVVMLYASYLQYHKKIDILWTIIGFIFLMAGGRQSFVGFFVGMAVVYYCLRIHDWTYRQIFVRFFMAMFWLIIIVLMLPFLLEELSDILELVGIDSRTMEMLTGNELTSTSTRDHIYEMSLYYVKNNLFDIKGFFADRYFLRLFDDWIAYPHNLILELMMDLGVVLGGIVSALILIKYVIRIKKGNTDKRTIIGIVATLILVRLMVSSSFMLEGGFYTVLGLLFNTYDDKQLKTAV